MEGNNHFLTRDQILTVPDIVTEEVNIPQWGGSVRVRSLTMQQRGRFEFTHMDRKGVNYAEAVTMMRARLVALAVVDHEGKRLFSDADVDTLNQKNPAAIETIFKVAMRLSGFTRQDVDSLEKNSASAQGESSSSS
jgi:hypothetical protein